MSTVTAAEPSALRDFLYRQLACWNNGDREGFMALYRQTAHQGLTLDYVGKASMSGEAAWAGLAQMWDGYAHQVRLQLVECLVNGDEAACYFRNLWTAQQTQSTGIETYMLRDGVLLARFYH